VAAYRRLNTVDAGGGNALGFGNSLSGFLLGRDDGDYYRSAGLALTALPVVTAQQTFSVRVYAERQRSVRKQTDFSLPHTLHSDHVFRPNIVADSADQVGVAITLRAQRGYDPEGARWGAEASLDGGAGTYGFGRASGAVRFTGPLMPRVAGAVELAGGMSAGTVPIQSRWYLGGPNTLRGYGGGVTSGDAYWRARAEIANRFPAARVALFCDVGRAGPREHLSLARPLVGAGVGASFIDGLVRIDLARALKSPKGWRLDLYVDGIL
jgi:hemolysin activation/secretion protein